MTCFWRDKNRVAERGCDETPPPPPCELEVSFYDNSGSLVQNGFSASYAQGVQLSTESNHNDIYLDPGSYTEGVIWRTSNAVEWSPSEPPGLSVIDGGNSGEPGNFLQLTGTPTAAGTYILTVGGTAAVGEDWETVISVCPSTYAINVV